jgi:Sec-independent protein secretion pathway component TatC
MEESALREKIDTLEKKIDAVYESSVKIQRYFQVSMIMTFLFFVLPLIGLAFAIPVFMSAYDTIGGLGL